MLFRKWLYHNFELLLELISISKYLTLNKYFLIFLGCIAYYQQSTRSSSKNSNIQKKWSTSNGWISFLMRKFTKIINFNNTISFYETMSYKVVRWCYQSFLVYTRQYTTKNTDSKKILNIQILEKILCNLAWNDDQLNFKTLLLIW